MPFLAGSLAFERFSVLDFDSTTFGEEHLALLQQYVAGQTQTAAAENVHVGFLGGAHLFDQEFDLCKNLINDAVHCSVRIDTNEVPAAIKKAWLQMELAALAKDSPGGVPTKSQKKEAKEAMEERCVVEAATGKYRKMQQAPLLWDLRQSLLYFGGSGGTVSGHCADLLERVFNVQLRRVSSGSIAQAWAVEADRVAEVDDLLPASFIPDQHNGQIAWANEHSQSPDFLGNEFLLWLWWMLETETDTIALADGSEVIVMLTKTLCLECPRGETGKETIASECPMKLPEAIQAIQSGKLPRKSGMALVRNGQRYDLVLQAESFGISGAKIHLDEDEDLQVEDRIDAIRTLSETVDFLFHAFCDRRTAATWVKDLAGISQWLDSAGSRAQKVAA
jgi:hypothetical protein